MIDLLTTSCLVSIAIAVAVICIGQYIIEFLALWLSGDSGIHDRVFSAQAVWQQLIIGCLIAPAIETLIFQCFILEGFFYCFRERFALIAWLTSVSAFTAAHWVGGVPLLKIAWAGAILSGIYLSEKSRQRNPIIATFLTHAIYNTIVFIQIHL
ncbi:CPBP family glutamic-type intramembrane protease [Paraburkholderia fynbosensis]|nr:CPBP family glutamic-type intramembrane protease [Paraburkholderia fynbosensis]